MLTRPLLALLFTATLLTVSGCIPFRYTITPPVEGCVVSATNQTLISQAAVSMHGGSGIYACDTVVAITNGHFKIPALKTWGFWMVPQEPYYQHGYLMVTAPGFATNEIEIGPTAQQLSKVSMHWLGTNHAVFADFTNVVIQLKPIQ